MTAPVTKNFNAVVFSKVTWQQEHRRIQCYLHIFQRLIFQWLFFLCFDSQSIQAFLIFWQPKYSNEHKITSGNLWWWWCYGRDFNFVSSQEGKMRHSNFGASTPPPYNTTSNSKNIVSTTNKCNYSDEEVKRKKHGVTNR